MMRDKKSARLARETLRISAVDMAAICGVTPSHFSAIESESAKVPVPGYLDSLLTIFEKHPEAANTAVALAKMRRTEKVHGQSLKPRGRPRKANATQKSKPETSPTLMRSLKVLMGEEVKE